MASNNAKHSEGLVVEYPLAASQTVTKGDFLKPTAGGEYVEVCSAADDALGVAMQDMETDASRNVLDSEGNVQVGLPANLSVCEQGLIWAKVASASELMIGDALELSAVDTLTIQSAGATVAYAKEYKPASSTPTNGTGYLKVVLAPGFR